MEKVLGRKQNIRNEDWINAMQHIEDLVKKEELDTLVDQTVSEILEQTEGKKAAFAWSGGKDSLVLERVCEMAGIHDCLMAVCDLEYPAFMEWVESHKPEKLEIINTGQNMDWLLKHQNKWVPRSKLKPNDYNPNKVSKENLKLLTQSILTNGWTLPIVVRPDFTIIDGFHRWTVAGQEPLVSMLDGHVPVVVVDHKEHSEDIYGTVTHNRARGTHLLEPMKKIVKELMNEGKTIEEIGKQLGMKPEEIFRLSDFSKEDFLNMMTKDVGGFSKAEFVTKI